jgi:hypothetical protein
MIPYTSSERQQHDSRALQRQSSIATRHRCRAVWRSMCVCVLIYFFMRCVRSNFYRPSKIDVCVPSVTIWFFINGDKIIILRGLSIRLKRGFFGICEIYPLPPKGVFWGKLKFLNVNTINTFSLKILIKEELRHEYGFLKYLKVRLLTAACRRQNLIYICKRQVWISI